MLIAIMTLKMCRPFLILSVRQVAVFVQKSIPWIVDDIDFLHSDEIFFILFCNTSQNIVSANLINKTSTLKFICQHFNLNTPFFLYFV